MTAGRQPSPGFVRAQEHREELLALVSESGSQDPLLEVVSDRVDDETTGGLSAFLIGAASVAIDLNSPETTIEPRPELVEVSWPPDKGGYRKFAAAISDIVRPFQPSPAFYEAVGRSERVYKALRIPYQVGPFRMNWKSTPMAQAVSRGHANAGERSAALLPVMTAIFRQQGITDQDELIELSEQDGLELLEDMTHSRRRLEAFEALVDELCGGQRMAGSATNPDEYLLYHQTEARLAGHFEAFYTAEAYDHEGIGCPTVLMEKKIVAPAWRGALAIARATGFFDWSATR